MRWWKKLRKRDTSKVRVEAYREHQKRICEEDKEAASQLIAAVKKENKTISTLLKVVRA